MASTRYWPEAITEPKLLLAEGPDAYWFCIWATQAYGLTPVQVLSFGGIDELGGRLRLVRLITGFENVETLAVIRDAEGNAGAAFESVHRALANADFATPPEPYQIAAGAPKTGVFLFPGPSSEQDRGRPGALEELCLATVQDESVLGCIDSFMGCLHRVGAEVRRPHKARAHSYLAASDRFVGMKLGEAAHAGAWDWQHPAMEPFRQFLQAL